jgi:hypothetical protein
VGFTGDIFHREEEADVSEGIKFGLKRGEIEIVLNAVGEEFQGRKCGDEYFHSQKEGLNVEEGGSGFSNLRHNGNGEMPSN